MYVCALVESHRVQSLIGETEPPASATNIQRHKYSFSMRYAPGRTVCVCECDVRVRRSFSRHHTRKKIDPTSKSGGRNHSYKLISIDAKSHLNYGTHTHSAYESVCLCPDKQTPKAIPYGRRDDYIRQSVAACRSPPIWTIILQTEPLKRTHILWPACERRFARSSAQLCFGHFDQIIKLHTKFT